ncbi:MAG: hypothetical protein EBZ95_13465 [Chitinophagia bacterium]|nr:hypothetical protein [Chitinophagia bacterium]
MTYINDLVVRNESGTGVVYAAVDGNSYNGDWSIYQNTGLYRSMIKVGERYYILIMAPVGHFQNLLQLPMAAGEYPLRLLLLIQIISMH